MTEYYGQWYYEPFIFEEDCLMRDNIKEAMDRYAEVGCPTGDFLRAVLENDLMSAFGRADEENILAMREIVAYVYNELPANCHGSPEIVRGWIKKHRDAREAAQANSPIPHWSEHDRIPE